MKHHQRRGCRLLATTCFVLSAIAPAVADPENAALQNACFPASALAAKAGEERAQKRVHTYDTPPQLADPMQALPIQAGLRGAIRRVELPPGEKFIALTLDLCEQRGEIAGYDGRIIDYLRREGVKATLFAGGKWMLSHQERLEQLMSDPLFEIANHTQTHQNLRLTDTDGMRREILTPQRIYEARRFSFSKHSCTAPFQDSLRAIPERMTLFRFPYGACNPASLDAVNDAGLLAIQWDVSTGDPDPNQSAARIAAEMIRRTRPGSIIIAHANGRGWHTAEALPIAITRLKALGYTFVTVSDLLTRGKPVVTPRCYDSRPGDSDRYDFLAGFKLRKNQQANAKTKTAKRPDETHTVRKIKRATVKTTRLKKASRPSATGT